jgi:hypothetical protein
MGTIFRKDGFRFFEYSKDHNFHVEYAGGEIIFEIRNNEIVVTRLKNMKYGDIKKAIKIIRNNIDLFK